MTRQEWDKWTSQNIILLDGATGSNLFLNGMTSGVCPELWILEHPDILINLQTEYLKAGTDILYTPTFSGNRLKLAEYGLEGQVESLNQKLVSLSKEAVKRFYEETSANRKVYLAGDLTMTGVQLAPMGTLQFEELIEVYKEQIQSLIDSGVDLLVIETMMSLQECRAALLAAKESCDLPVMITLTFGQDKRTLYGTDPKTAIIVLEAMGAAAVGINCSTGPEDMVEILSEMKQYAGIPLIAKPNAGLPKLYGKQAVYEMKAEEFAQKSKQLIVAGAGILGGCCGTTPEHIHHLKEMTKEFEVPVIEKRIVRALTTERKTLFLPLDGAFQIIGERINPTGKKALQQELKEGKFDLVTTMAQEQTKAGAGILDLNMGMNGIDEKEMMLYAIQEVMAVSDLPLSIDSSHTDIIEAALRIYPGRALINSISMEKEKMQKLLAIAKKYGAMFILLPLSDTGLPKDLKEKKEIIHTIIKEAKAKGLKKEDIVVDGLVNTIGANPKAALETIETIRYCKEELGLATVCGLSNISFGLPERALINTVFLTMAIQAGLTMAISNPCQELLVHTALAAEVLQGKEEAANRYITRVSSNPISTVSEKESKTIQKKEDSFKGNSAIFEAVLTGKRKKISELVEEELSKNISAKEILDEKLIPAINETGKLFEKGIYFLPQLISSAETMKIALERLEPLLKESQNSSDSGTVVIATVAGDIHDIGKNLVALMLKNYGFHVIDLGKDVPSEEIIETAKKEDADIIALSALMTTTMLEMKEVVRLKKEAGLRAKVMIGGAVITQSYCEEIGADGYSKDAKEAVVIAKRLVQEGKNSLL